MNVGEPKKDYLVIVSGMSQAGSSLCYNLLRLLIERAHHNLTIFHQERGEIAVRFINDNLRTYTMCKQHDLPRESPIHHSHPDCLQVKAPAWTVFNVKRDIRDTVASALRKNPAESDIIKLATQNMQHHYDWSHLANYEWVYENYKKEPLLTMKEMQQVLHLNLSDQTLKNVIHQAENLIGIFKYNLTEVDKKRFYDITRLESTQITNKGAIGGYKDVMTPSQVALLEEECADWLREHGYTK
jgi:hypothetical protein